MTTHRYTFWIDNHGGAEDETVTVEASTPREAAEKVLALRVENPADWDKEFHEDPRFNWEAEFENPHTEEDFSLVLEAVDGEPV